MKVTLLYRDREWGRDKSYFDKEEICKDLNLNLLFKSAASRRDEEEGKNVLTGDEQDEHIIFMMRSVMMTPLLTEEEIRYRQSIVEEAINNHNRMGELYRVSKRAMEDIAKYATAKKKMGYGGGSDGGRKTIANIEYLERILYHLGQLDIAFGHWRESVESPEMKKFIDDFFDAYGLEYRECLEKVVRDLRVSTYQGAMDIAASLGPGLSMSAMVVADLRESKAATAGFWKSAAGKLGNLYREVVEGDTLTLDGDDQNLLQDIQDIKNATVGAIMNYFEPFLEESENFFKQLRSQTAFLMGAVNLYRKVKNLAVDFCFPTVTKRENISFEGLVEMSLAVSLRRCPVDNTLSAKGKHLLVVTGANQGGKSTFLRSIGIAQILLQCGMYVPAKSFSAGLYRNVFTHFTRKEDSSMNSGRLDEELGRMERIVDHLTQDSVLFLNESFATTTEKEGSIIAEDITKALYEKGIRVMMVTHLLAFAKSCYSQKPEHAMFLSAERKENGARTYRMIEQEPEMTSYGLDLYDSMIKNQG